MREAVLTEFSVRKTNKCRIEIIESVEYAFCVTMHERLTNQLQAATIKSLSRVKTTLSSKSHTHIRNTEHFQTTTGAGSLELIKRANISIEAVLQKELKTMSAVK